MPWLPARCRDDVDRSLTDLVEASLRALALRRRLRETQPFGAMPPRLLASVHHVGRSTSGLLEAVGKVCVQFSQPDGRFVFARPLGAPSARTT